MAKNRQSRKKPRGKQGRNEDRSGSEISGTSGQSTGQSSRNSRSQIWLFGNHAVYAALLNPQRPALRLLVTAEALPPAQEILSQATKNGLSRPGPEVVERAAINQVLPEGAVHQGIALEVTALPGQELEDISRTLAQSSQALVVIIDQGTDPRNVGAVMRTACAFGAACVIVQDRHAPDATGVLAKAASGALETLPLVRVTNVSRAIEHLKDSGFWSVGLAGESDQTLDQQEWPDKTLLIIGAEGKGMRRLTRENCDFLVKIPMTDHMESLNMSNAAAIALYEIFRSRQQGK